MNIFLSISFSICFGCSKEMLIETVLLSTHNICIVWEIRKLIFIYALYSKGLYIDRSAYEFLFGDILVFKEKILVGTLWNCLAEAFK